MNCCEIGSHHDALVYTAGAIKHLSSNNSTTQKELVSLGGIEGLGKILDAISKDVCSFLIRQLLDCINFINEKVLDLPKTYKFYSTYQQYLLSLMCISFNFSIGVDVNEREFTVHRFTCPGIKVRTTLLLFKISKSLCDYRMKFHLTLRRRVHSLRGHAVVLSFKSFFCVAVCPSLFPPSLLTLVSI